MRYLWGRGALGGLWDAHVMPWGAWWGHGMLIWGHVGVPWELQGDLGGPWGARVGSWGTCGDRGALVELGDARVMSWVLCWVVAALVGLWVSHVGPRGVIGGLVGYGVFKWSHGGLGGVMGCSYGVTRSLGGTWGAHVGPWWGSSGVMGYLWGYGALGGVV